MCNFKFALRTNVSLTFLLSYFMHSYFMQLRIADYAGYVVSTTRLYVNIIIQQFTNARSLGTVISSNNGEGKSQKSYRLKILSKKTR